MAVRDRARQELGGRELVKVIMSREHGRIKELDKTDRGLETKTKIDSGAHSKINVSEEIVVDSNILTRVFRETKIKYINRKQFRYWWGSHYSTNNHK